MNILELEKGCTHVNPFPHSDEVGFGVGGRVRAWKIKIARADFDAMIRLYEAENAEGPERLGKLFRTAIDNGYVTYYCGSFTPDPDFVAPWLKDKVSG